MARERSRGPVRGVQLAVMTFCAGGLVMGGLPALAAQGNQSASADEATAVDPNAIKALDGMGAFLRSLPAFEVEAETTTDEVLDSGQKIQLSADAEIRVRRPDRLQVDLSSDRKQRQFWYDGKTFTINGPRSGYYASFDAPPTLAETLAVAEKRYGIELPLADLFYWGTDKGGVRDIQSAIDVGPATIDGVETEQYAFRQKDVDWQIWIQKGDTPLPRKLVITSTSEPSQPQHVAVLDWDLHPDVGDAVFAFTPPKGSHRISFEANPSGSRGSP